MDAEGFVHDGTIITAHGTTVHIDFKALVNKSVMIYGQTEVTHDLYDSREAAGAETIFEVDDVVVHDADTDKPHVT